MIYLSKYIQAVWQPVSCLDVMVSNAVIDARHTSTSVLDYYWIGILYSDWVLDTM